MFHKAIGRQATVAFANAHRAACGVEPHPDILGRCDGIIQPRPVRIKIEVIRGQRAARERQFRKANRGRNVHFLWAEPRPNRIERFQPPKEQRILPTRHRAGQRLIKVVVRVHQTRRQKASLCMDDLCVPLRQIGTNCGDHTTIDQNIARKFTRIIIHRQDGCAFDQCLCHVWPVWSVRPSLQCFVKPVSLKEQRARSGVRI